MLMKEVAVEDSRLAVLLKRALDRFRSLHKRGKKYELGALLANADVYEAIPREKQSPPEDTNRGSKRRDKMSESDPTNKKLRCAATIIHAVQNKTVVL